jgi:hypothetical protein
MVYINIDEDDEDSKFIDIEDVVNLKLRGLTSTQLGQQRIEIVSDTFVPWNIASTALSGKPIYTADKFHQNRRGLLQTFCDRSASNYGRDRTNRRGGS